MFLLSIAIISISSKTFCDGISPTSKQPTIEVYDSEHLHIDYSSSFDREIDPSKEVRLVSSRGHNYSIVENKVKTNVCNRNLDDIWVQIDEVKSEHFGYIPFTSDVVIASAKKRVCRMGDNNSNRVRFDYEGLQNEQILYESCLKYVQFCEVPCNQRTIGEKIKSGSPVIEVPVKQFQILIQMKTLATSLYVNNMEDLEECSNYEEEQENSMSLIITGVVFACVLLVIVAVVMFVKHKKTPTNTEIDQNPEYGQQEYYYHDEQKRTNIVEENEEYYGGVYTTDKESYVKDANNTYADLSIDQD